MLVLTRKKYQQLTIQLGAETVIVRVVNVGRGQVRLGIIAPKTVSVHRQEIADRIAQQDSDRHAPSAVSV